MSVIQSRDLPANAIDFITKSRYGNEMPAACGDLASLTFHREELSTMADDDLTRKVFVYKITCLVNGKQYIGVTARTVQMRWGEHVATALRTNDSRAISRAIRRHGPTNFAIETVFVAFGRRSADLTERHLIITYGTLSPFGYNLSTGGEGIVGKFLSDETKKKISAVSTALWADPISRARLVAAIRKGASTPKHINHLRKLAAAQKGISRKPESVARGRQSLMGHAVSDETKLKISVSRKGKAPWSPERKASHGARIRQLRADGRYAVYVITPEHRAAMSAGRLGKKRGPYKKKSKDQGGLA